MRHIYPTFYHEFRIDNVTDPCNFIICKIAYSGTGIYFCLL